MSEVRSALDFEGIILSWGDIPTFCRATRTPDATVRAWISRDHIPSAHWRKIIEAARAGAIRGVSLDSLYGALQISLARSNEKAREEAAAAAAKSLQRNGTR